MREIIVYLFVNRKYLVKWGKYLMCERVEVFGWYLDRNNSVDFIKNIGFLVFLIGK